MNLPVVAAILTCIGMGAANGGRVAIALLALKLQSPPLVLGVLLATYSIIAALFSIPLGRAVDRMGIHVPLLISTLAIGLGLLVVAAFPTLVMLFVAAMLIGTGAVGIPIALNNAVGMASDPAHRARNFATYTIGVSASNAIGPMAAGFAIDGFGFQGGFASLAVLSLVMLVLVQIWRQKLPAATNKIKSHSSNSLQLLLDPKLRPMYIAGTMLSLIWDGYQFVTPIWGTRIGLSASSIGIVLGSFSTSTFAIRTVLPLLSFRFKEWTLISATVFIGGLGYALFPFASEFWSLVLISCLLGAGFGFGYPMILSVAFASSPKGREAEVTGVRSALSSSFRFVSPLALGALATVASIGAVVWGIAAIMFAGSWHARIQNTTRDKR